MASATYLSGDERATVAHWNALYSVFDAKLSKILSNCSPILAFNTGVGSIPPDLMGKCFFFVPDNGIAKYAYRCPGARVKSGQDGGTYIDPGTGLPTPRPWGDVILWGYNHQIFLNAQNSFGASYTFDDANKIVTVPTIGASYYTNGLSAITNVSIFDHSLAAHKVNATYLSDPPVQQFFYIKESHCDHNEKHYRYAVAELILDGVTELSIPDTWDKYCFFRIHNLNYAAATVTFGKAGGASELRRVVVPALHCKTVRRDRSATLSAGGFSVFTNYRVGGGEDNDLNYFFKFEGARDLRHYWHFPSTWVAAGTNNNTMSHTSRVPANSMCANNLTCPSIIYDWIRHFRYDRDSFVSNGRRYAWFHPDEHQVHDIEDSYADLLAKPSNPNANLGDLVWHKGNCLLVKFHKTNKIPATTLPDSTWAEIPFNGLATIAADWAAYGINVTTDANGLLGFQQSTTGDHANWEFLLIPWGTNLFRLPNDSPRSGLDLRFKQVVDPHWFDQQGESCAMNQVAPQFNASGWPLVPRRNANTAANTKTWAGGDETGDPIVGLVDVNPPNGSATQLWNPQSRTVSELLTLKYFGDKNFETQSTAWTHYANVRCVLTPHGHVLLFDELIPLLGPFQQAGNDVSTNPSRFGEGWELYSNAGAWFLKRKRVIKLRGHGFGWKEEGRIASMHYSGKYGRHLFNGNGLYYERDMVGPNGADYRAPKLDIIESSVKVQRRVKTSNLGNNIKSGRFWRCSWDDKFVEIWDRMQRGTDSFKLWLATHRSEILDNLTGAGRQGTYPLLAEHFNGMAMAVNQLTTGKRLDFKALRFIAVMPSGAFAGQSFCAGFTPKIDGNIWNDPGGVPVPVDCFDYYRGTPTADQLRLFALYQGAGIPIRTLADRADYAIAINQKNVDRKIDLHYKITVSGAVRSSTTYRASLHTEMTSEDISYVDNAAAAGTAFFYNFGAFRSLQTEYANFHWVSTTDVLAFLDQFGIDVAYDEIFTPLKLDFISSGREKSNGSYYSTQSGTLTNMVVINSGGGIGLESRINGTYFRKVTGYHRNVSIVAFAPVTDAEDAQWKVGLVGGRVARDIKFWDTAEPVYEFVHGGAVPNAGHNYTGENVGEGELKSIGMGVGFHLANNLTAGNLAAQNQGPFGHFEFSPEDDDDAEAEHELWLKMNHRILMPIAVRMVTNLSASDITAPPNIVMVHKDFWAVEADAWLKYLPPFLLFNQSLVQPSQSEEWYASYCTERVGNSLNATLNFSTLTNPYSGVPNGNKMGQWLWTKAPAASAAVAPSLQPGINILPMPMTDPVYGSQWYCNIVSDYVRINL